MKILVLGGGGFTGRIVARRLLERSAAFVTIAMRHPETARALVDSLNALHGGRRVAALYADAADVASLRKAFEGHALVIAAAPIAADRENVFRAAIDVGADCLDLQISAAKFALLRNLAPKIERQGRLFITEAGFHPGLPAALARHAAAQLDAIESVVTAGFLNMGWDLPYSEAFGELVEALKDYRGETFKNGAWTKPGSFATQAVDFGGDIGQRRCYSMYFEELRPLPEMFPSLKDVGFFIAGSHWVADWLIFPLVWIAARLGIGSLPRLGRFLWWGMRTFHRPPYRVELVAQASGTRAGRPARVAIRVAHRDGYELTAVPIVATILQYLDGPAAKRGLWMMGHYVDPARLMRDMAAMGVETTVTVE